MYIKTIDKTLYVHTYIHICMFPFKSKKKKVSITKTNLSPPPLYFNQLSNTNLRQKYNEVFRFVSFVIDHNTIITLVAYFAADPVAECTKLT